MSPPLSLRRNAGFSRLWSARLVARFGGALGYVVLIWYVFAETGSALAVVYVGLAEFVPTAAFAVFAGALVDRYDRRRVVVLSTLGRGVAMGALALTLLLLGFNLPVIVVAAAAFAVCATFFGPGSQALLPEIVSPGDVDRANGLFESSESVVAIVGSALAGFLVVAVGAIPSLGIDAGGFVVASLFVALIVVSAPPRRPGSAPESLLGQVKEGLAYLRRATGLLELTIVALVSNFLFSIVLTFLVVYTAQSLHGTAVAYGILEGLLAAGWGVGGLAVSHLKLTRHTGTLWQLTGLIEGGAVLGLVLVPTLWVAFPLFLGLGIWQGILNVTWLSSVQVLVPQELQGRYLATDTAIGYAAIPASQILGGVLIVVSGLPTTFLIVAVGSLVAGVGYLALGSMRKFGYDPRTVSGRET